MSLGTLRTAQRRLQFEAMLLGEHLLSEDKSRPVALVESEKTALIALTICRNSYG